MKNLFFIIFIAGNLGLSNLSLADTVTQVENQVIYTCENAAQCKAICGQNSCPIVQTTCSACARSSDQSVFAVFRSFDFIYQKKANSKLVKLSDLLALKKMQPNIVAIFANSPLNIFSDPFDASEIQKMQKSLDAVCGSTGNHFILAESTNVLVPRGIVCETPEDKNFYIFNLQYRPDYFNGTIDEFNPASDKP